MPTACGEWANGLALPAARGNRLAIIYLPQGLGGRILRHGSIAGVTRADDRGTAGAARRASYGAAGGQGVALRGCRG
jgi:hypothetical protein